MEEITPFLSAIGLPAGLITLIAFLLKLKLITLYSSSPIEKVLMSKERRLFVKMLEYVVILLVSILITTALTITVYYTGIKYNEIVFYILTSLISLVFLFFLYCNLFNIHYRGENPKRMNTYTTLSISYIFFCYIIFAYYSGTVMLASIGSHGFLYNLVFSIISSFIFSISPLILIALSVISFFNPKYNLPPSLYIIDKENRIWYIYQPVEKEQILLGNTPAINDCNEYIVIDKSEVLKLPIHKDG